MRQWDILDVFDMCGIQLQLFPVRNNNIQYDMTS